MKTHTKSTLLLTVPSQPLQEFPEARVPSTGREGTTSLRETCGRRETGKTGILDFGLSRALFYSLSQASLTQQALQEPLSHEHGPLKAMRRPASQASRQRGSFAWKPHSIKQQSLAEFNHPQLSFPPTHELPQNPTCGSISQLSLTVDTLRISPRHRSG